MLTRAPTSCLPCLLSPPLLSPSLLSPPLPPLQVEAALQREGQRVPNLTHPQVPIGGEEHAAVLKEVRVVRGGLRARARRHCTNRQEGGEGAVWGGQVPTSRLVRKNRG